MGTITKTFLLPALTALSMIEVSAVQAAAVVPFVPFDSAQQGHHLIGEGAWA